MKKTWMILMVLVAVFCFSGGANAALTQIGTASWNSTNYYLIYDDTQSLVWLDYSSQANNWQGQMDWVAQLHSTITLEIDPLYSVVWSDDSWRLPQFSIGSEMNRLIIWNPSYIHEFKDLKTELYWTLDSDSNPDYAHNAWWVDFGKYHVGGAGTSNKANNNYYALAVRTGQLTVVPLPGAVWLLGSGLAGLALYRRKVKGAKGN